MANIKVAVIVPQVLGRNGIGFMAVMYRSAPFLRDKGLHLDFIRHLSSRRVFDYDVCIVPNKVILQDLRHKESHQKIQELFTQLRENGTRIIFYDMNDDSTTGHWSILPYVDVYCKSYVLKKRHLYLKAYYGRRIWTDYYHSKFGVVDAVEKYSELPPKNHLYKIKTGFLLGLYNCDPRSFLVRFPGALDHVAWSRFFRSVPSQTSFFPPSRTRPVPISCRFVMYEQQRTINFQRECVAELLKPLASTQKVNIRKYIEELRSSKVVVSPFGWGEINVRRDYEAAMNGTVLVKPSIEHIDTYPPLFNNNTIVQVSWDFSDFFDTVDDVLVNYREQIWKAEELQDRLRFYLATEEGWMDVAEHVARCIMDK